MGRLDEGHAEARRNRQLPGTANPADFSEALARGIAVLLAFNSQRKRMTQADLARELDLSRATVRRAVLTLEHLGYLVADGRTYELTPQVLRLTEAYLTSNVVSTVLQPTCDRICNYLKASCSAAVLDGSDAVMIARSMPQPLLMAGSGVGYRIPAQTSALGKVLLAHCDSTHAPTTVGEALDGKTLQKIRDAGYCYVANDVEAGFHSIAVPIRRWDGRVIAALNVGASLKQPSPEEMLGEVFEMLKQHADELQRQLV
ncbi:IclR family transcriptional regulator domain-containing protein [Streptomyces chartreusis]|uniref:IclR family transcriptional regulator domain-containing protein n=1 Tax=Streptomyces chartreusis TaxID=1969 RepID=UPI0035DB581D